MSHVTHDPRCIPVPEEKRARVAELVKELGPTRAAKRLNISRSATLQIVAIGESMRGTLAVVDQSLEGVRR